VEEKVSAWLVWDDGRRTSDVQREKKKRFILSCENQRAERELVEEKDDEARHKCRQPSSM
jgi:hypothetical protein